jgi:hypothetical protein
VLDFPIRVYHVYLQIIRGRWLNEVTAQIVLIPISIGRHLVADGTRVTQEFAPFLKEISGFHAYTGFRIDPVFTIQIMIKM